MKRNMDLLRSLVFAVEEADTFILTDHFKLDSYDRRDIIYHFCLLKDAELIGVIHSDFANDVSLETFTVTRLTFAGHDFADAARDPSIWAQGKKKAASTGLAVTYDILMGILKGLINHSIGV